MKKILLVVFFLMGFSTFVRAENSCFEWEFNTIDQKIGKCTNQNYEILAVQGGPLPLICTNMTYPLHWSCFNIHKFDGTASADLDLEDAAEAACGC